MENMLNRRSICNITLDDFEWKIINFSKQSNTTLFQSPVFGNSYKNNVRWKLRIFNADTARSFIYLDMYKYPYREYPKVYYYCTYSVIKNDGSECSYTVGGSFKNNKNSETLEFMPYSELISRGYVNNDTLHIKCKVGWSRKVFNNNLLNIFDADRKYLNENMTKDIGCMYEIGRFSDVCLDVDGIKFPVHRFMLAARSSVFSAMFEHDMKEKEEKVVKIKEIKPEIMKAMLSFIYTNHIDDFESKIIELLKASDMYDVKDLKLLCESSLAKSLKVHNVATVHHIANIHNAKKLKQLTVRCTKNKRRIRIFDPLEAEYCVKSRFKYLALQKMYSNY